jgi:two-component system nitrogen regulation response regulator NtrX
MERNMKGTVLVVDDEVNIRETISDILTDENYKVILASDGNEAEKKFLFEDIDVVILDILLPDKNGMEILKKFQKDFPIIPVIIISGHADIKMAVEAMKIGAFDFIEKPLSIERLISTVKNALMVKQLRIENINLKLKIPEVNFIGKSPVMREILDSIEKIAQSDASVMITGENGTGKELIARILHNKSKRRFYPFVGINCAAIPETLIESELFGYEKGAFTGATKQKKGKIELAHKGTLFLDEVADLSLSAQAKILRVLQERQFERIGGHESISVDVRIISATNKDLMEEMKKGNFREDLFYRLNVIPIHIPPLRERKEDIRELANFFLSEYNSKHNTSLKFTEKALKLLEKYDWPGNVRELKNFLERVFVLSESQLIDEKDILKNISSPRSNYYEEYEGMTLKEAKIKFEKQLITSRLLKYDNNISKAAESLGIDRTYLHKKINELGIFSQKENFGRDV